MDTHILPLWAWIDGNLIDFTNAFKRASMNHEGILRITVHDHECVPSRIILDDHASSESSLS